MTRVYKTEKSRVARQCERGHEIPVGSALSYATPGFRGRTRYFCAQHPPRRSDLTANGPLSTYYSAVEDLEAALAAWDGESADDLRDALDGAAEQAREAVDEWSSTLDNMGDGLSQGETGQLIQERLDAAEEFCNACDDARNRIEDFAREDETPPGDPDPESELSPEEQQAAWTGVLRSEWADEQRGHVQEALDADQL